MDRRNAKMKMYFWDRMIDARIRFNELKKDDEARKVTTEMGKKALIYNIVLLIFLGAATALVIWGVTIEATWRIALFVAAGILAVAMIPYFILVFNFSIKQLCLNKRAIGWVSLIMPFVITIAVAVAIAIVVL